MGVPTHESFRYLAKLVFGHTPQFFNFFSLKHKQKVAKLFFLSLSLSFSFSYSFQQFAEIALALLCGGMLKLGIFLSPICYTKMWHYFSA